MVIEVYDVAAFDAKEDDSFQQDARAGVRIIGYRDSHTKKRCKVCLIPILLSHSSAAVST